jgi:hypothetical protein
LENNTQYSIPGYWNVFLSIHSIKCFSALIMTVSFLFTIPVLVIITFQLSNKFVKRRSSIIFTEREKKDKDKVGKDEYEKLI